MGEGRIEPRRGADDGARNLAGLGLGLGVGVETRGGADDRARNLVGSRSTVVSSK